MIENRRRREFGIFRLDLVAEETGRMKWEEGAGILAASASKRRSKRGGRRGDGGEAEPIVLTDFIAVYVWAGQADHQLLSQQKYLISGRSLGLDWSHIK